MAKYPDKKRNVDYDKNAKGRGAASTGGCLGLFIVMALAVVIGLIAAGQAVAARPMIVQNAEQVESSDAGVPDNHSVSYCETNPLGTGYKTFIEVVDGAAFNLYGWQVAEDNNPSPVNADSWVRTGDATGPQDRRVTWCHYSATLDAVQVQTKDGSNFRITGLHVKM